MFDSLMRAVLELFGMPSSDTFQKNVFIEDFLEYLMVAFRQIIAALLMLFDSSLVTFGSFFTPFLTFLTF